MTTYDISIPGLKRPATESEIWDFVKCELDKLVDALKNQNQEEVGRISSGICSLFEQIREEICDKKKTEIEREIVSSRFSDGSEEEHLAVESDIAFDEAFPFATEMLEELEILPTVEIEKAIKFVTNLKAKWYDGSSSIHAL